MSACWVGLFDETSLIDSKTNSKASNLTPEVISTDFTVYTIESVVYFTLCSCRRSPYIYDILNILVPSPSETWFRGTVRVWEHICIYLVAENANSWS